MSTNNEGTPTPLTDAAIVVPFTDGTMRPNDGSVTRESEMCVHVSFARQLERSLTATKQRLEVAEKERDNLHGILEGWGILHNTPPLLPTAKEQRDWFDQVWKATCEHLKSDTAKKLEAKLHPSADKAESNEDNSTNEQKLWLSLKPCGDCWLHIDAPSGKRASINLGQRGSFNDQTIVGRVIREVAEMRSDATTETNKGGNGG